MKHLGKLVLFTILACNLVLIALLLMVAYSTHISPVAHPIWSCIGLSFPIFLFLNVCFLLFWLIIQQYKAALVALAGLLCCYPQIHTYIPFNLRTAEVPQESFKVLSYNVMGFCGAIKKEGHNPILDYLQESNADILCLQEYHTGPSKRHLTQQDVEHALKAYPYHRITPVGEQNGYTNLLACYSKFPILSDRRIEYDSNYNGSVVYELKVGQDTLLLINNHLESNKLTKEDRSVYEEMLKDPQREKVKSGLRLLIKKLAEASALRAPQADSIAAVINRSPHDHIVVCGDFNDNPISYAHHTIVGKRLTDAFAQSGRGLGISYNENKFYFRIDNILISKNMQSYNCTVDRFIKESDHYPIWCYMKIK